MNLPRHSYTELTNKLTAIKKRTKKTKMHTKINKTVIVEKAKTHTECYIYT